MLLLLDDDGSSSSFLGYVASNKLPHLISIGLRIKYVSFSYRWPLVKLRKQTRGSWNDRCTVSLFTLDGSKIGLLQFSLEPWENKRSVPVFPQFFFSELCSEGMEGRLLWFSLDPWENKRSLSALLQFFFSELCSKGMEGYSWLKESSR